MSTTHRTDDPSSDYVGRRIPVVLAPGMAPGMRRLWRVLEWFGWLAGIAALALVAIAAIQDRAGLPLGTALAVGVVGLWLLGSGEWTRRLLSNDTRLREAPIGSGVSWGAAGGGGLGSKDYAAMNVTPWGLLHRNDALVLLRRAGLPLPASGLPPVAQLARAVDILAPRGGRPVQPTDYVSRDPALAGRPPGGIQGAHGNATVWVLAVLALGVAIFFGWTLVSNLLDGDAVGAALAAVVTAISGCASVAMVRKASGSR